MAFCFFLQTEETTSVTSADLLSRPPLLYVVRGVA